MAGSTEQKPGEFVSKDSPRCGFHQRRLVGELMDDPELDDRLHHDALKGLARANSVSFSSQILSSAIQRLAQQVEGRPLRIVDIACGGGDVTLKVAHDLELQRIPATIIGCDVSRYAVEHARANAVGTAGTVEFQELNALTDDLPECDIAMSSLFLHHLTTPDAVRLLERMADCAEHLLINDLRRSRLGYWMAWCVCRLLTRSKIVHTDGPLSVEAAFTPDEALAAAEEAGLVGAKVCPTWPERFLLQWSRPL
jgi:SAM-dependent methyltransferase